MEGSCNFIEKRYAFICPVREGTVVKIRPDKWRYPIKKGPTGPAIGIFMRSGVDIPGTIKTYKSKKTDWKLWRVVLIPWWASKLSKREAVLQAKKEALDHIAHYLESDPNFAAKDRCEFKLAHLAVNVKNLVGGPKFGRVFGYKNLKEVTLSEKKIVFKKIKKG